MYIRCMLLYRFFLHKMLASHRQPTFRDSRWTNYSNPGQLYPPRPPNFKVVVFFQGLRRVDKTNQTPQHDISRTHSLTLTFGEGGVFQSFPRGLNILSIYGMSFLFQYLYTKPYLLEPKRSVAVECEHPKSLEKILENQVEYEAFTNQLEPSKKT